LIVSESGLSCAFSAFACGPGGIDGSPGRTSDLHFERTERLARLNEGHVAAARVSRRLPLVDQEDHVLRIAANEVERSSMSGASTVAAGIGVRSNLANFSTLRPDALPIPATFEPRSTVGILITHALLLRINSKLWFLLQM
jgi:hypothetical protein